MGFELKELKETYKEYQKKYKLPSFEKLNEDFEIEKIDKKQDCFLRTIRKVMMEKIVNSLGFLEMLTNPINAPKIYYPYLKNISAEDRNIISELYSALGNLSMTSLSMEIDYAEKGEADFINQVYKTWNEIKPKFRKMMVNMQKPNISEEKKEKSYFG